MIKRGLNLAVSGLY